MLFRSRLHAYLTGVDSEIGVKTSAAANDMDEQVVAMDGGGMAAAMNGRVPSTC